MIDEREEDLIVLKSLKVLNENFIKKHYSDIYNRILNYCCEEAKSYSFQHKLTWYFLGIKDFPKCEICGNINKRELKWSTNTKNMLAKFCSKKCYYLYLAKLRKQTCIEKYGVSNISQLQSVKDKKKETCLEHYGSDNPSKVQEIQDKKIQTNIERYGFKSAMHNDQIKLKLKESFIKKYGTNNPMHIEKFRNKLMQTNMERFGYSWILSDPKTIEKTRNTCREKYGVDWPTKIKSIKERISKNNKDKTIDDVIFRLFYMFKKPAKNGLICLRNIKKYELLIEMTSNEEYKQKLNNLIIQTQQSIINNYGKLDITEKEIREINKQRGYEKAKKTSMLLYGKPSYSMTDESRRNQHIQKLRRYYLKYQNSEFSIPLFTEEQFIQSKNGNTLKWKCKKCGKEIEININTMFYREVKCKDCYKISVSSQERELIHFLNDNNINDIECNVRDKLIQGKEIDIYISSKKLAIEFDGLYWHSSAHILNDNYHLNKTIECEKQGIQLIHIFENEWSNKKDIVKSRLLDILGKHNKTVYARQCEIKEITQEESKEFLNDNHLQGFIVSKYRIGLFYNNELISLMTFGNYRKSLGRDQKEDEYEMLRFCNKLNYHIPGSASKLLTYFIKTYNPKKIISYCDRRWSQGKLYESIGFQFIKNTQPNYWYIIGDQLQHRFEWRKSVLKDKLLKYDESKTEFENMKDNNYFRIYDCGNKLYELNVRD